MAGNSMNTTQQLDSQSSFTRPQLRKLRPLPSRNSQTWRKPLKTPAPVPSAGIATPSSVAVVPVVDAAAVTTTAGNATSSKVKFEDTDFEEVVPAAKRLRHKQPGQTKFSSKPSFRVHSDKKQRNIIINDDDDDTEQTLQDALSKLADMQIRRPLVLRNRANLTARTKRSPAKEAATANKTLGSKVSDTFKHRSKLISPARLANAEEATQLVLGFNCDGKPVTRTAPTARPVERSSSDAMLSEASAGDAFEIAEDAVPMHTSTPSKEGSSFISGARLDLPSLDRAAGPIIHPTPRYYNDDGTKIGEDDDDLTTRPPQPSIVHDDIDSFWNDAVLLYRSRGASPIEQVMTPIPDLIQNGIPPVHGVESSQASTIGAAPSDGHLASQESNADHNQEQPDSILNRSTGRPVKKTRSGTRLTRSGSLSFKAKKKFSNRKLKNNNARTAIAATRETSSSTPVATAGALSRQGVVPMRGTVGSLIRNTPVTSGPEVSLDDFALAGKP